MQLSKVRWKMLSERSAMSEFLADESSSRKLAPAITLLWLAGYCLACQGQNVEAPNFWDWGCFRELGLDAISRTTSTTASSTTSPFDHPCCWYCEIDHSITLPSYRSFGRFSIVQTFTPPSRRSYNPLQPRPSAADRPSPGPSEGFTSWRQ